MKRIVSLLALICFIITNSGCITLKLSDSKPGSGPRAAICEKRTAVRVLEDRRTVMKLDRRLSDDPTVAVSRALVDKFREHCPDTVKFVDRQAGVTTKTHRELTAQGNFDFLLTGSLDRFHSEYEDNFEGLRLAGAILAGLTTPVGLLLLPVLYVGYADHVSDVDFTISLVEASTGTILWTKRSEFRDRERIAFIEATGARIEDKLNRHLERETSAMFANVSSAFKKMQMGTLALGTAPTRFPQNP